MTTPRLNRLFALCLPAFLLVAGFTGLVHASQPQSPEMMPLADLRPGMSGEVWTVFRGTEPEPFSVEVTGVIENALGPGKSMILCELTDDRVQHMGAVAGMSGSPLYIGGRLAGALSYQVQQFETVRFAGFTPVEDLLEVRQIAARDSATGEATPVLPAHQTETVGSWNSDLQPLNPVFALGGISPQVRALVALPLEELGIQTTLLGGATTETGSSGTRELARLQPGQAVAAALAVGDITLAGTGTVSQVDGERVLAFGHPLLGLGEVEMPMMTAEVVTILPSNMSSVKVSNTGQVIGTVRQDRLSAIYGEMGDGPDMLPISIRTPSDQLEFSTVRHTRITPMIAAIGLSQAVMGSNEAGMAEGFRLSTTVNFTDGELLEVENLYAGPKSFANSMSGLTADLSTWLQNPVEEAFPQSVEFTITPLDENPLTSIDNLSLSHRSVAAGEELKVTVQLRDFQSSPLIEEVLVPISAEWVGRKVEVIVTNGRNLDLLAGGQRTYPVSQIRDLDAYIDVLRRQRSPDGFYVAVVTQTEFFSDQTTSTAELPGSLARTAQTSDEARFLQRKAREVLWEKHLMPDRLVPGAIGQSLVITP